MAKVKVQQMTLLVVNTGLITVYLIYLTQWEIMKLMLLIISSG